MQIQRAVRLFAERKRFDRTRAAATKARPRCAACSSALVYRSVPLSLLPLPR
jgi:hypothetical protein